MALPTSYLTSSKNLEGILNAIRGAQAPAKFTNAFLESLEFKSSSDRLFIGVFKSLGFLDDTGRPSDRYFRYLDQTQSEKVMAEAVRAAYEDLFRINVNAHTLSKQEVVNKFKTLGQGALSDAVLDKMAMTFSSLVKFGDFSASAETKEVTPSRASHESDDRLTETAERGARALAIGGLVYNVQIVLPESRDPSVYDALFGSLRRHLL